MSTRNPTTLDEFINCVQTNYGSYPPDQFVVEENAAGAPAVFRTSDGKVEYHVAKEEWWFEKLPGAYNIGRSLSAAMGSI